jgi:hypothetical protein
MARKVQRYDHPSYIVAQHMGLGLTAAGASGTNLQQGFPNDVTVKRVTLEVRTAGTTDTHAYTIRKGTSSLGAITVGEAAAGTIIHSADLDADILSTELFNLLKSNDNTGVVYATMQFKIKTGALITV